jgi:anti-anti-sigma factor
MNLNQKGVGSATLATAAGRIDLSNADDFTTALSAALTESKAALILDLSKVDYISSAGLRSLMITLKASKTDNKGFGVTALQPMLAEIFTIARLNQVIPIFQTTREAVAKLAPDALAQFDAG